MVTLARADPQIPIHRSVRFLLATATAGSPTRSMACRFGETEVAELEAADADGPAWHPIRVTLDFLSRISGDDMSLPWLKQAIDVAIVERAASLFPPIGSSDGWGAHFGRELNASDDRDAFTTSTRGLPVVEGKQIDPFRVDLSKTRFHIDNGDAARRLSDRRFNAPRLGYRDVASASNRLTLIAAVLPAGCVSTHTVFCLRTPLRARDRHFLCGLFNSFVLNYLVRLRVSTHVTTAIVEHLPIPRADRFPRAAREIAAIARLLARRDDVKAKARLQAIVAGLYQLSREEFAHVLSTFPLIPQDERDAAYRLFATEAQRH